ncbi:MAG: malto-oligosyltrehalose trehalohydrolase [Hyphomicrobiaceae bacterium]
MTLTHSYMKTWGAELLPNGGARFKLWAPSQSGVSLVAPELGKREPMEPAEGGWFMRETNIVPTGGSYAFQLATGEVIPDPAARAQIADVHGPSALIDPKGYSWETKNWTGRPWHEAVIYELHTGTFTSEGTFAGLESKLDHLVNTGVTAVELMPVAHFSGVRGWGYDGVLLYAPHTAYGTPKDLKRFVDRAHARGLMVLLDVVYNHFGPDGNYLHLYAPEFFDTSRQTPWGAGIDYTRPAVRRFCIENALFWLEEYQFDGLRLDAIDQISDPSTPHILEELATEVRQSLPGRHIHLTTEDERNISYLHERSPNGEVKLYSGEWNDDVHHVAHVIATGESDGYYADYAIDPLSKFRRALAEGYVYQGEPSIFKEGVKRGVPSDHLPPLAFIDFLQNHDQIGNRAFGERLSVLARPEAIELLTAILLLCPHIPLLYMGEEWGETRPFCFFTDFQGRLAEAVREGRRNEFSRWPQFRDPSLRSHIPDPNAVSTFETSRIDWNALKREPHKARQEFIRKLLEIRQRIVTPLLAKGAATSSAPRESGVLDLSWRFGDVTYKVVANPKAAPQPVNPEPSAARENNQTLVFEYPDRASNNLSSGELPAWSGVFMLMRARSETS